MSHTARKWMHQARACGSLPLRRSELGIPFTLTVIRTVGSCGGVSVCAPAVTILSNTLSTLSGSASAGHLIRTSLLGRAGVHLLLQDVSQNTPAGPPWTGTRAQIAKTLLPLMFLLIVRT